MALTELQEVLMQGLKEHGLEEDNIVGIMLTVTLTDTVDELIDFLLDTPKAKEEDILRAVVKMTDISEEEPQNTTPEP